MSFVRPGNYPYPHQFKSVGDSETWAKQLYAALQENDRTGEFLRDRAPSADLKALMVRPEWYGAKGNGTTDDTAAIQAAIDSLADGGRVILSRKTYLIASTLYIRGISRPVIFEGQGGITSTRLYYTGSGIAISAVGITGGTPPAGECWFELHNIELLGTASGTYGIKMDGNTRFTAFHKVRIEGFSTGYGLYMDGAVVGNEHIIEVYGIQAHGNNIGVCVKDCNIINFYAGAIEGNATTNLVIDNSANINFFGTEIAGVNVGGDENILISTNSQLSSNNGFWGCWIEEWNSLKNIHIATGCHAEFYNCIITSSMAGVSYGAYIEAPTYPVGFHHCKFVGTSANPMGYALYKTGDKNDAYLDNCNFIYVTRQENLESSLGSEFENLYVQVLGPELLTDGGLETWASTTNLTNWTEAVSGTSTVNQEATEKHGGTYSCRLDIDAVSPHGSTAEIYQVVTLATSTRHKLSFWYKTAAGATAVYSICDSGLTNFLAEDGTWPATYNHFVLPPATDWAEQVKYFTTDGTITDSAVALVSGDAESTSIYFDDVSIKTAVLTSVIDQSVSTTAGPTFSHVHLQAPGLDGSFGDVANINHASYPTTWGHSVKASVSSTASLSKIKFAIASGESSQVDTLALDGNGDATISNNLDIGGAYKVDGTQVVGNRVVDADFANTPNSGDTDTDDLIDKIRDALITHGLIASS